MTQPRPTRSGAWQSGPHIRFGRTAEAHVAFGRIAGALPRSEGEKREGIKDARYEEAPLGPAS